MLLVVGTSARPAWRHDCAQAGGAPMKAISRLGIAAVAVGVMSSCGGLGDEGPYLDPNAVFEIQPQSAQLSPNKDNGSPWDQDDSIPDVTLRMWCTDGSSVQAEEVQSLTPEWHSG